MITQHLDTIDEDVRRAMCTHRLSIDEARYYVEMYQSEEDAKQEPTGCLFCAEQPGRT